MSEAPATQAQRILDQLVTWLSEIQQVNGYYTDTGLDIRTEQDRDEDPLAPCLLVLDEDAAYSAPGSSQRGTWTQLFTLEGLIGDDGDGRRLGRQVLADLHRALRRRPTDWPPEAGVLSMSERSRELPRRPSNSDWLTPSVSLEITYVDKEV
ncbi:hypothetical protein [Thiocystis violacea]|uniref:hypothetical protein n=1 Tax=Thiocystis violacea TaxID=13725 RepID=UPI0019055323|nr:hypothetical protein [Thiocystis violacea]MBK1719225.1 hypothetical protein [Thiocystis violacea]